MANTGPCHFRVAKTLFNTQNIFFKNSRRRCYWISYRIVRLTAVVVIVVVVVGATIISGSQRRGGRRSARRHSSTGDRAALSAQRCTVQVQVLPHGRLGGNRTC